MKLTEELAPGYSISVESTELLATADGPFPLEIHQTKEFGKTLYMGGHFMTSERDEFVYHELMVHPAMIASAPAESVLVIGGGDGGAIEEVLKHRTVQHVRLVEIDESVIKFSDQHLATINRGALQDPKVCTSIYDGYDFMMKTQPDKVYDVIILDLTDPEGPAERLYTTEFFRMCKYALTRNGAFVLHLGPVWTDPARVQKLAARLRNVFYFVHPFTAFVPLYGTLWTFAICRDGFLMPTTDSVEWYLEVKGITDLKYYSPKIHEAMFALPPFVEDVVASNLKG